MLDTERLGPGRGHRVDQTRCSGGLHAGAHDRRAKFGIDPGALGHRPQDIHPVDTEQFAQLLKTDRNRRLSNETRDRHPGRRLDEPLIERREHTPALEQTEQSPTAWSG